MVIKGHGNAGTHLLKLRSRTHTCDLKLEERMLRFKERKGFLARRAIGVCNSLPQLVVEAKSITLCKNRLDDYLDQQGIQKYMYA